MSWFSIASIKEEMRKISWPKGKDMVRNTKIVLAFILFFVAFFFLTEFVLLQALRLIGIGA